MFKFGLLGLGYIANRHIDAIKATGNEVALTFSPDTSQNQTKSENEFFQLAKEKRLDFISICSPTFLHQQQIQQALNADCNVIVEKPACLTLPQWETLHELQTKKKRQVSTIFQLRYHPIQKEIEELAKEVTQPAIKLTYKGNRDEAYFSSWKGNVEQSGGILAAVGIHLFDLLFLHFGGIQKVISIQNTASHSSGEIVLKGANVKWDFEFVPKKKEVIKVSREFLINEHQLEIGTYSNNLHQSAYEEIFKGKGVSLVQAKEGITLLDAGLVV